jgi:hypothetical protein
VEEFVSHITESKSEYDSFVLRTNSVGATVFFAAGTFLSYALYQTARGFEWGAAAAIVSCAVLLPMLRLRPHTSPHLDAQEWTPSSTKGAIALFMTLASWCRQLLITDRKTAVYNVLYFVVAGMTLGVSLYFHDYLGPVGGVFDLGARRKALEMEHAEVLALLTFLGTAMLILFAGLLGGYILGQFQISAPEKSPLEIRNIVRYLILGLYPALGFMLWVLRPFHARAKEIRISLLETTRRSNI